ncbi:hypothetical protein [Chamaesiphon sp. VAR_48_metabat_135_sub]|uniref:sunset domain-containing protein n=1 Tax=Chamaesiphon sp. VAR_48_metabat_135_sub TaxID=2964699 RepID=UPI00286B0B2C|nr:hypothetical protein [Chamaesiphon sp. VAR_48_metabat_135_sub]
MKTLISVVTIGGIALFSNRLFAQSISPKPGCNIKGNISWSNENKLYHLPGMKDYQITKIDLDKGERWFCTESEAIASGWKKAPK